MKVVVLVASTARLIYHLTFTVLIDQTYVQFYDVENQATLKQTEHFRCNYIEWDPSGRYACTAVSQPVTGSHWKAQMDNGYQLFSFQVSAPVVG